MSGNGRAIVDAAGDRVVVDGLLRLRTRWRLDEMQIFVAGEIELFDSVGVAVLAEAIERDFASKLRFVFSWSDAVDRVLVRSRLLSTMRRGSPLGSREVLG